MGRREKLADRIAKVTDIHAEPLLHLPLIEVVGRQRVLIENHQGVDQYSHTQIGIKVSYGRLCVFGTRLHLLQMSKERLVITGCIENIQLLGRR